MRNARQLADLSPALRAALDAEVAAGNEIADITNGFPAPPIGFCIVLRDAFRAPDESRAGLDWRRRQSSLYSGELTDADRRIFLLTPPNPDDAAYPDMDAIRAERDRANAKADAARFPGDEAYLSPPPATQPPERRLFLHATYRIEIDYRGEMLTYLEPDRSATIVCTWWGGPARISPRTLSGWWYPTEQRSAAMTPQEQKTAYANILDALRTQGASFVEE